MSVGRGAPEAPGASDAPALAADCEAQSAEAADGEATPARPTRSNSPLPFPSLPAITPMDTSEAAERVDSGRGNRKRQCPSATSPAVSPLQRNLNLLREGRLPDLPNPHELTPDEWDRQGFVAAGVIGHTWIGGKLFLRVVWQDSWQPAEDLSDCIELQRYQHSELRQRHAEGSDDVHDLCDVARRQRAEQQAAEQDTPQQQQQAPQQRRRQQQRGQRGAH